MAADGWQAFKETGDVWSPAVAAKMKAMLAAGATENQAELYRKFRGRGPEVSALLEGARLPRAAEAGFNGGAGEETRHLGQTLVKSGRACARRCSFTPATPRVH